MTDDIINDIINISDRSKRILVNFKNRTADFQELTKLLDDKLVWSKDAMIWR